MLPSDNIPKTSSKRKDKEMDRVSQELEGRERAEAIGQMMIMRMMGKMENFSLEAEGIDQREPVRVVKPADVKKKDPVVTVTEPVGTFSNPSVATVVDPVGTDSMVQQVVSESTGPANELIDGVASEPVASPNGPKVALNKPAEEVIEVVRAVNEPGGAVDELVGAVDELVGAVNEPGGGVNELLETVKVADPVVEVGQSVVAVSPPSGVELAMAGPFDGQEALVGDPDASPMVSVAAAVDESALNAQRTQRKAEILGTIIQASSTVVLYPLEFARTLIQVGYEPVEPIASYTLFRRPCLLLPNIFQYVKYIKSVDGITGCYRGLIAYLLFKATRFLVFKQCKAFSAERIAVPGVPNSPYTTKKAFEGGDGDGDALSSSVVGEIEHQQDGQFRTYLRDMGLGLSWRLIATTASYPFHVIAIHCMAAFVGREPGLSGGIFAVTTEIWKAEGVAGFLKGLTPRLMGEAMGTVLAGLLTYIVKIRVSNDELRGALGISISVLSSAVTHVFNVVAFTMALNNGCSTLGNKPFTPKFSSWYHCWSYLKEINQLRRGSSLAFRYYTGPTLSVNGVIRPSLIYFGPNWSQDTTRHA